MRITERQRTKLNMFREVPSGNLPTVYLFSGMHALLYNDPCISEATLAFSLNQMKKMKKKTPYALRFSLLREQVMPPISYLQTHMRGCVSRAQETSSERKVTMLPLQASPFSCPVSSKPIWMSVGCHSIRFSLEELI